MRLKGRPILDLVSTVRSRWVEKSMLEIRHRLCPESAVLSLQDGLGVLEEVFAVNFPDPLTRPAFRLGPMNQGIWETVESKQGHKINVEDLLNGVKLKSTGFRVGYEGMGRLLIGPLAIDSLSKGKIDENRKESTQYLIDQILAPITLRASTTKHNYLLYKRYKKLVLDMVTGPLATLYECNNTDILLEPQAKIIMAALIKEAWEVAHRDVPGLSIDEVNDWIRRECSFGRPHSMAWYAKAGRYRHRDDQWLAGTACSSMGDRVSYASSHDGFCHRKDNESEGKP